MPLRNVTTRPEYMGERSVEDSMIDSEEWSKAASRIWWAQQAQQLET